MTAEIEFGLATFGESFADQAAQRLTPEQAIRNIIDESVLADDVGIDFFGIGEHHREDFAVACPDVVLAGIAGKTCKIRLGSAVTVIATDDPVRVYQRFSTLNALASGRAELVLGRGWYKEPFDLFGYDFADIDRLFEDKLKLVVELMTKRQVTWSGLGRPPLSDARVYPRPKAHRLPVWVAVGSTPDTALKAAYHQLPIILSMLGGPPSRPKPLLDLYRLACEKYGNQAPKVGLHCTGFIAEDDTTAIEEFWQIYKPARDRLGAERGWPPLSRGQYNLEIDKGSLYVGSASRVAQRIAETMSILSASRFQFKYSVSGASREMAHRTISLFGRVVIPAIKKSLSNVTESTPSAPSSNLG